jgi:hypothetical protein
MNVIRQLYSRLASGTKIIGPFATELVSYVFADGSNQVAVSANIHDMEGLMAWMQRPEAVSKRGRRYAIGQSIELVLISFRNINLVQLKKMSKHSWRGITSKLMEWSAK